MKRAEELLHLSREHHGALVLAKRIAACPPDTNARLAMCEQVSARFQQELAPHFAEEEQTLLPLMRAAHPQAVQRTLDDHVTLRALAMRLALGDETALPAFGKCLAEHVRFEERELFPLFEALLSVQKSNARDVFSFLSPRVFPHFSLTSPFIAR